MENAQIKADSAYNKLNYFMGAILMAAVIFLAAFFFLSYRMNTTASLQQKENVIATIGNLTNLEVIVIE